MGAFKLGKMTFGSLFKKPETVKYPFEEKPKPVGLKGRIVIDEANCIVCGMCDRSCSTDCIKVDRKARTWEIDPFACVQCGYCVTVCPKKCLAMDPHYSPVAGEKRVDVHQIPEQVKEGKSASTAAATAAPAVQSEPAAPKEPEKPPAPAVETGHDEQLQTLLSLMDAGKAEKVKAAMAR